MKLSIIVPVYKVEDFLDACVRSILEQDVDDCEVILVDDCSPDRCGAMCDDWAKKDSRIKVVHCSQNGGLSYARNQGLKIAKGEYVTFVDSDDFLAPDTYKENLALLDANTDVDVLEFPVYIYYGSKKEEKYVPGDNNKVTYVEWLNKRGFCYCYAWNKIYRKELWADSEFPEGKLFEDILVIPSIMEKCRMILRSNKGLYYYCDRNGSISNTINVRVKTDYIKANMLLFEKLEKDERVETSVVDDLYLFLCNAQIVLLQLGGDMLIPERKIPLSRSLFVSRPIVLYVKAILKTLLGKKYCTFMAKSRNLYSKL